MPPAQALSPLSESRVLHSVREWCQPSAVTPSLVYLIGFPAAGKYTIARELADVMAERDVRMVVVDNHHINNVVFAVIDTDGKKSLPPEVWKHIGEVRAAVLAAIRDVAPPEWSYVFTNVLIAGVPGDERAPGELAALAEARGSAFVPVVLRCDTGQLEHRIVTPERKHRMKWVDPVGLRGLVERSKLVDVSAYDNALELDVTTMSPRHAALAIAEHIEGVTRG